MMTSGENDLLERRNMTSSAKEFEPDVFGTFCATQKFTEECMGSLVMLPFRNSRDFECHCSNNSTSKQSLNR